MSEANAGLDDDDVREFCGRYLVKAGTHGNSTPTGAWRSAF